MNVVDILSTVRCTVCHSHVVAKLLSEHVCPLTQSHRYSQVSHYDVGLDRISVTLPESIWRKRNSGSDICSRCHRGHATISLAQKLYHPHCLTCFVCRSPLGRTIKVFEGQIYCLEHFHLIISRPTCSMCHKIIESNVRPTIALGKLYHPEHLRCHQCNKTVDTEMTGLMERKGKIYCQSDFNDLYLPKCVSCHRVIEKEGAIVSKNKKLEGIWHQHCFRCYLCGTDFPNNQFYIFDNAPYCKLDYHRLNKTLCMICSKPVEGICGELPNGSKVHPGCFTCNTCQCKITDIYFVFKNRIYCQDHCYKK